MRFVPALLCVALMCGCGGDGPIAPGAGTVTLTVSSTDVMTSAGDTRSVAAVVRDGNGSVVPSTTLTWSSSTPGVATVSGSGPSATVTAVDDGTAIISATNGSHEGAVTVTVRRALVSVGVSAASAVLTIGSTTQLSATGYDARGNAITSLADAAYFSSNPGSVIVAPSGLVTALFNPFGEQRAIVTATLAKDGVTASGTVTVNVTPPPTPDYGALMLSDLARPDPVSTPGQGIASFYVDGTTVSYMLTWSALSGPATGVHLHGDGASPDALVDFMASGQTATHGVLRGSFTGADIRPQGGRPAISLDSLIVLMRGGKVFADVHTDAYAGGEIRGPIAGPFR